MTGQHSPAGYEKRDVNLKHILWYTVLTIVVITVSVVALTEYFVAYREELMFETMLKPPSEQLLKLRAYEDSTLASYELIDEESGQFWIPIDQAMKLVVEETASSGR
ncbi:MAG: hypothetical protein ACE5FH_04545 [Candidatus Zixiibacteriota bacterium]